jgi:7,8-dihydroneopterin aldolase/epimerase/oxygenase
VVDYDFIRREIMARVAQGHIHLQETLADDVLRHAGAPAGARRARRTEKPDVYPDCDAVGCEVFGMKERPNEHRP